MTTYSLAFTGVSANDRTNVTGIENIPDADSNGNASATHGGFRAACSQGAWMLIKTHGGTMRWGQYDAERSTNDHRVIRWMTG